jgi:glycosyltransferase involved in cell wall biosynthesis
VLIDLSVAPPGGAGTYAMGFVTGLLEGSVPEPEQLVIVAETTWANQRSDAMDRLRAMGVTVDAIDVPPAGTWKARLRRGPILRKAIARHGIDIAYFPREVAPRVPVPYALLAHNLHAWKRFVSSSAGTRGSLSAYLLRRSARSSARRASAVMVVSGAISEAMDPSIRVTANVHLGCSLPEHERGPDDAPDDGERRVAMVCTVMANKRIEVVVEAIALAKARTDRWHLDVYGGVGNASYAEEIEQLSQRLLGETVQRGRVEPSQIADVYQRAHVLVLGGSFEAHCLPLVEGMRSGCVVVAPDCTMVRELCGDAAITYQEGDAQGLADALEQGWERRAEMSRRGVEQSRSFTWAESVEQALAVTRSIWTAEHDAPATEASDTA